MVETLHILPSRPVQKEHLHSSFVLCHPLRSKASTTNESENDPDQTVAELWKTIGARKEEHIVLNGLKKVDYCELRRHDFQSPLPTD